MNYDSPEAHRDAVIARFAAWKKAKYDDGQTEHGGRFWRKPVVRYMRDEIVDLCFYYDVMAEQHEFVAIILEQALLFPGTGEYGVNAVPKSYAVMALNILRYGNPEGEVEEEFNGPKGE